MMKSLPANAEDMDSISGPGRSSGGGNGNPFQYSCLEKSTDRGAKWATVLGVTKSQSLLSNAFTFHFKLCFKHHLSYLKRLK